MQSSRKKLTSLLGGIAIAFAMMLFMPSAANATWGKYHDSCSSYQHGSKKHGSKSQDGSKKHHGSKKDGSHGSKKHDSCKTKHGSKSQDGSKKHHGSHKHGSYKHGSHKHGSHCTTSCSDYEKLVEKYKNLSEQYLAKYNSTHCYTYYRHYLCYAKKYEYYKKKLEACKPATPDCDKYKTIADQYKVKADQYKVYADKYLAAYNRCHYYCYYYYYACYIKKYNYYMDLYNQYMEKYNNCRAKNIYGEVHGSIYEDKDADKIKDADEYGMAGIVVLLTDTNGTDYNTTTDATGHYAFTQIAKGAATVTVTDDAFPAYTELYTENNPATVIIESGKDTNAGDVGYIFPEPSGSLTGKVFEDSDESGDFTDGEVGANGITIVIVDKNGDEQSITTTDGSYHFDRVVAGPVDIAVSHLPSGADISIGSLSFSRNVVAGQENIATDVGYTLPVSVGILQGKIFEDTDEDGAFTDGETGAYGIVVSVTDSEGNVQSIVSTDGRYRFVNVAEGDADIAVTSLPANAIVTIGDRSFSTAIVAGEENTAEDVGYTIPVPTGSIYGTVYFDQDKNGVQDASEIGEAGIKLNVLDANDVLHTVVTDDVGDYRLDGIPVGVAAVSLVTTSLPENMEHSSGNELDYVTVMENNSSDAGKDGYSEVSWGM